MLSCHSASGICSEATKRCEKVSCDRRRVYSDHFSLNYGKILSLRRKIVRFQNLNIKVQMDVLPNREQKQVFDC